MLVHTQTGRQAADRQKMDRVLVLTMTKEYKSNISSHIHHTECQASRASFHMGRAYIGILMQNQINNKAILNNKVKLNIIRKRVAIADAHAHSTHYTE